LHNSGTILWNTLPSNLKTVINVDIFKRKYSEYLLLQQEHDLYHIKHVVCLCVWCECKLSCILM